MICPHCKKALLELVEEDYPWTIDHYQCPECDSTYNKEEIEDGDTELS